MKLILLTAAWLMAAQQVTLCQTAPSIPSWLANYPGVAAETTILPSLMQSTYKTSANVPAVVDHYRGLFETQKLPFMPNPDGIGAVIRAEPAECDLLITIHPHGAGSFVEVSCAAKSKPSSKPAALPQVIPRSGVSSQPTMRSGAAPSRIPATGRMPTQAEAAERHKQLVGEMGIHKVYTDAPAPPLVWPSWLVHLQGAPLKVQTGMDQSKNDYLGSAFVTSAPMTAIFSFYEDLLNANGYRVHSSKLGTGQTTSGISQNADGYVEGSNYPNGSPGPWTVIRVTFSRFYLNEPIKVRISFTAHAFKAPKRSF